MKVVILKHPAAKKNGDFVYTGYIGVYSAPKWSGGMPGGLPGVRRVLLVLFGCPAGVLSGKLATEVFHS